MAITRNVGHRCRFNHRWQPVASTDNAAWLKCAVCGARMKVTG